MRIRIIGGSDARSVASGPKRNHGSDHADESDDDFFDGSNLLRTVEQYVTVTLEKACPQARRSAFGRKRFSDALCL
jgi:hypothetical protein